MTSYKNRPMLKSISIEACSLLALSFSSTGQQISITTFFYSLYHSKTIFEEDAFVPNKKEEKRDGLLYSN